MWLGGVAFTFAGYLILRARFGFCGDGVPVQDEERRIENGRGGPERGTGAFRQLHQRIPLRNYRREVARRALRDECERDGVDGVAPVASPT